MKFAVYLFSHLHSIFSMFTNYSRPVSIHSVYTKWMHGIQHTHSATFIHHAPYTHDQSFWFVKMLQQVLFYCISKHFKTSIYHHSYDLAAYFIATWHHFISTYTHGSHTSHSNLFFIAFTKQFQTSMCDINVKPYRK